MNHDDLPGDGLLDEAPAEPYAADPDDLVAGRSERGRPVLALAERRLGAVHEPDTIEQILGGCESCRLEALEEGPAVRVLEIREQALTFGPLEPPFGPKNRRLHSMLDPAIVDLNARRLAGPLPQRNHENDRHPPRHGPPLLGRREKGRKIPSKAKGKRQKAKAKAEGKRQKEGGREEGKAVDSSRLRRHHAGVSDEKAPGDVTGLLHAWTGGDVAARDELMAAVYRELHQRAAARLRRERDGHTLQPTALVHEAYLRLIDQKRTPWQNRAHFLAIASEMMRRILVDHARRKKMVKRSGRWARMTLHEAVAHGRPREVDLLDLDRALEKLAGFDPRKARIAELRFFGGLSIEETGEAMGISVATVERDWQTARAWLFAQLKPGR